MSGHQFGHVLAILHYVYPTAVFLYFAISYAVAICTLQTASDVAKLKHPRHKTLVYLSCAFILCYIAEGIVQIVRVIVARSWPSQDTTIGILSCILVFGIELNSLWSSFESIVWYPFYGSWLIAFCLEPTITVLTFLASNDDVATQSGFKETNGIIAALRIVISVSLIMVYFVWRTRSKDASFDEERDPLLGNKDDSDSDGNRSTDSGYGTNNENSANKTNGSSTDGESPYERQQRLGREKHENRLKSEGNWLSYVKGFMVFFPYIWPVGNRRLQFYALLVGLCLLTGNVLNFLIPRQLGAVMDSLSGDSQESPWVQVLIFALLRLLASEAGINLARQFLWMPVELYSEQALSTAAYSHVMNLSSEFHDSKSSSDLMAAITRGRSVSNMLESICFSAIPMMIDLVVAFSYLSAKFGPYEGFITIATGLAFMQAAARMVSGFQERRQKMVKAYFEEHYVRQAGIQGWHTVSAFNQVPHEESRYGAAVKSSVNAQRSIYSGYLVRQALQYLILLAGLLAGSFLAVYQVSHHQATAGDFVMLLTYWSQLTAPLKYFSMLGKSISQDMVEAERLLDLMLTKPTIVDKPNAKPLKLKGGKVDFKNVSFSYDKTKVILKSVSLSVPSGKTVAFVGATGAGKSTILKLLDRFYDVTGGSILIDGQDIRDVTLTSVRQTVGIVPQAPILFDDTVMNNVRYARLTATDEEIYSACKAAAMHDQIMGFTEGYKTRVGERGVKLSGGELQRIAIARAILKQPNIVLLDEATSSVDTETEQKIQDGLRNLCDGRTTFIVAHRLSTVMNADSIFVVSDGQVIEEGDHDELLAKKGKYAELWSKQIFAKPKDQKKDGDGGDDGDDDNDSEATEVQGIQADGATEEPPYASSTAQVGPNPAEGSTTPKASKAQDAGEANGQEVETPNGHKREGSRLNPGAPEFTPRSLAARSLVIHSPAKSTWAEDVEFETCQPRHDESPTIARGSTHRRSAVPVHITISPTSPSAKADAKPTPEATVLEIPEKPQHKPRRNTPQSASCPEPMDSDSEDSPTRCVSQPVPPLVDSSSPKPRTSSGSTKPPTAPIQKQPVRPVGEKSKSPPIPSRPRGGLRGRGFRGRYRGSGRGARNMPNPNPTGSMRGQRQTAVQ